MGWTRVTRLEEGIEFKYYIKLEIQKRPTRTGETNRIRARKSERGRD